MGWLFSHFTKKDLLEDILEDRSEGERVNRILKHSLRGQTLYTLHETGLEGDTTKWIGVFRLAKQDGLWGYKDMDESMGPIYYDCPLYMLKEADPPANEYARQWREEVRVQAEKRKALRKNKPKVGERWALVPGCKIDEVLIVDERPLLGRAGGTLYRIKRRHLDHKIEEKDQVA